MAAKRGTEGLGEGAGKSKAVSVAENVALMAAAASAS